MTQLSEVIAGALGDVPDAIGDSVGIEAVDRAFDYLRKASGDRLLLSVYRRRGSRLWLVSIVGYSGVFDGITMHRGIMAQAARTGRVQWIEDTSSAAGFLAAQPGIISELAIPIGEYVVNVESTERLEEKLVDPFEALAHLLVNRLEVSPVQMTPASGLSSMVSLQTAEEIADYACSLTADLLDLDACQVVLGSGPDPESAARVWVSPDSATAIPVKVVLDLVTEKASYASWIGHRPSNLEGWLEADEVIIVPFNSSGMVVGGMVGGRESSSPGLFETDTLAAISGQVTACLERIELEQSLNAALAARSDFMAAVSHELRTPLTAILGYSELLLDDAASSDEEIAEFIAQIRDGASHLLALVTDLLDTVRAEAGTLRVSLGHAVSLRQTARDVAAYLEPTARKAGCEVKVDIGTDVVVSGDPVRIRQIVLNLVSNALKFTQGGTVQMLASDMGTNAHLEVVDDGIGIDPDELATLFKPFSGKSVHDPQAGTGLGLVISRHLAHAMGGSLELHSSGSNHGTTARLTLPLWRP